MLDDCLLRQAVGHLVGPGADIGFDGKGRVDVTGTANIRTWL